MVAQAFISHWVAVFGATKPITTDQCHQFESALFQALSDLLGSGRTRTRAYHQSPNGVMERFDRQLKASLKAHANTRWTESLPIILQGIRTVVKSNLWCCAAELVFGTTLKLP